MKLEQFNSWFVAMCQVTKVNSCYLRRWIVVCTAVQCMGKMQKYEMWKLPTGTMRKFHRKIFAFYPTMHFAILHYCWWLADIYIYIYTDTTAGWSWFTEPSSLTSYRHVGQWPWSTISYNFTQTLHGRCPDSCKWHLNLSLRAESSDCWCYLSLWFVWYHIAGDRTSAFA